MGNPRQVAACITMVICLVAVAFAAKIKFDYDKTADFASYKTYVWGQNLEPQRPGANIVFKGAVDYELQAKGLQESDFDHADLLVRYQVAGDTDMNVGAMVDPTYAFIGGIPWPGATVWTTGFNVSTSGRYIRKGSVVIDVFDINQHKLIWSAMAVGALDNSPKKAIEEVNKVVTEMFTHYPLKKSSVH